jgi:DedD protein
MPDASAKSVSPEALELKRRGRRRLLGAVVIALLLVVFVPMVLDSEPRKAAKEIALAIPAKEGQPPLPAPGAVPAKPAPKSAEPAPAVPKADEAAATPESKLAAKAEPASAAAPTVPQAAVAPVPAAPAKVEPKAEVKPAETKPEPKPAQVKPVEVKPAAESKAAAKPEPKVDPKKLEGFVVQLGAFSEGDTVKQLVAKLRAAKIPVFTEPIKGESGTLTRVRAGPYKTRELADKGLAQVKKAGADGKVVPLP